MGALFSVGASVVASMLLPAAVLEDAIAAAGTTAGSVTTSAAMGWLGWCGCTVDGFGLSDVCHRLVSLSVAVWDRASLWCKYYYLGAAAYFSDAAVAANLVCLIARALRTLGCEPIVRRPETFMVEQKRVELDLAHGVSLVPYRPGLWVDIREYDGPVWEVRRGCADAYSR